MHGPAVTTGAPLPYNEQAIKSLGPPRAFHAPRSSVPMITLSSTLGSDEKVTKVLEGGVDALQQTPFAKQPAPGAAKKADGRSLGAEGKRHSLRTACGPPTQGSLQSCESTSSTEVRMMSLAPGPQTVTTAQNIQGVTGSSAVIIRHRSVPESQLMHACYGGDFCGAGALTNAHDRSMSLGTAVTTGHTALQAIPHTEEVERRGSLRKLLKRKATDDSAEVGADWRVREDRETTTVAPDRQQTRRRQRGQEAAGCTSRERREVEIQEAYDKIASLEAEQAQWRQHCLGIQGACSRLHTQLREAGQRCAAAASENRHLLAELKYLRENAGRGRAQESAADEDQSLMDPLQWQWDVEQPCSIPSPSHSGDAFFEDFVGSRYGLV